MTSLSIVRNNDSVSPTDLTCQQRANNNQTGSCMQGGRFVAKRNYLGPGVLCVYLCRGGGMLHR